MNDPTILSSFADPPHTILGDMPGSSQPVPPIRAEPRQLFDTCHTGLVLRTVGLVESVVLVAQMFVAHDPLSWAIDTLKVSAAVLPATLIWLALGCMLKRPLAQLPLARQFMLGTALGAVSGVYSTGLLFLAGVSGHWPWLAGAGAGAMLAALVVQALVLRLKAQMPADTAARLAELQSRIRPHFLFNTLNSAIALVRSEPERAEVLLEDLSDVFRHALKATNDPVTLAEEIELARHYLDIEKVRFGARLRVEWSLDPMADLALLPPMLMQPLVENAIKHGLEPSDEGALINVTTDRRGPRVVIKVTNTVHFRGQQAPSRGHGIALVNVRERLRLMYDMNCAFQAVMREGLFQVRIDIPAPPDKAPRAEGRRR